MSEHGLRGVADAGAFLARLTRLDPGAPVRLRGASGRTALWAHLPWDVLASRAKSVCVPFNLAEQFPRRLTPAERDFLKPYLEG